MKTVHYASDDRQSLVKSKLCCFLCISFFFFLLFALLWTTEWCLFQFNSNPRFQKALIAVFCAPKSSPSLPHRAKSCSMPDIISLLRCAISNSLFYSQIPRTVLDVSVLSDDELIQKIRSWGGTPKALTENKDMMKIAVRVLRADLTLLHNYRYGNRPLPLDLSSVHMMTGMIIFTEK